MLKKITFILILLQLLSLLDACCGGGRFETRWVRFKIETFSADTFPSSRLDSIAYGSLVGEVRLEDSLTRIATLRPTGLTPAAYGLQCDPNEIIPLTSIERIRIVTLTDLNNQVPAMSDVTNLFIDSDRRWHLDSTRVFLNEVNLGQRGQSFFRFRFQPPFAVRQMCRFRMEIRMSDGLLMQQETDLLKLF